MSDSSDVQLPPAEGDTWLGLSSEPLPVAAAYEWAIQPDCGAVVLFSGTARDHSVGREEVSLLEYEAYTEQVVPRFAALVDDMRVRWPDIRRAALIHRVGPVPVGESAVIVVVSSPHRGASFEAGKFAIDTLKATAPIWKREKWRDGESWGLEPQHIQEIEELAAAADESVGG